MTILNTVLETARLIVRPATVEDVKLYYDLWTNPQVMQYVGFPKGLRISRKEIAARIAAQMTRVGDLSYDAEAVLDQLLVVVLKATGETIGECKLGAPDEEGVAEPDTKLLPAYWGHQYGTEVWQALVDYLFTHTDCVAVVGSPNVENVASIKMQEAAGGVRVDEGIYEFPEAMRAFTTPVHYYIYRVSRENWRRKALE
jgi:[ribosomal protein S5]-alanine N-acetyltransferase